MAATWTDPRDPNQKAARALGYTGVFGSGGIDQWRLQNGISDTMFQGAGGYKPLDAQIQGSQFQGGVSPVGVVEPFNNYQKSALTQLAQPLPNAPDYGLVQRGTQQMGDGDYQAGINRYSNPYTKDVINSTVGTINDQASQDRARLIGGNAGSRSFGSSSGAIQLAQLDKNTLKQIADSTAGLNNQNYNQASANTVGQWNTERNRDLAGEGVNIASTQARNNMSLGNIQNLFGAGGAIQNQNQQLLNVLQPQIQGATNYPTTSVTQLAGFLNAFPGSQTGGYQQGTSAGALGSGLQGIGMMGAAGIFNGLSGNSASSGYGALSSNYSPSAGLSFNPYQFANY